MFHSIIVPVDGSALAERALRFAVAISRSSHARLTILQVVPSAGSNATNESVAAQSDEVVASQTYVDALVGKVGQGVEAEGVVTVGEAAPEILEEAGERKADLVVMSTHGRSGLGRWIYGSVADDVMRHAELPVLLVPAHAHVNWPTDRAIRILVPLDGSGLAENAIPFADNLADALGGELLLVRAVELHPPMYGDPSTYVLIDPTVELESARARLEQVANDLRSKGRKVEVAELLGFAVSTIADFAHERKVDVIAMSTHGSGGLTRLIMGSVATGIVQRAGVPVLVVRPRL